MSNNKNGQKHLSLKEMFIVGMSIYVIGYLTTNYFSNLIGSFIGLLGTIILLVWAIDGIIYLIKNNKKEK